MTEQHIETVNHLKKKLDKGVSFEKTMHILYKLQKFPISVKLLEETGIGSKLRELSKQEKDNDVGKTAKVVIMAWKEMIKQQQQQQEEDEEEDLESERRRQQQQQQQNRGERQKPTQQQQQQQQMDSEDNHEYENGDEEDEDETPRSDRSEESVSQNYHHHQHQQHKKKHKKKKKKSKENNNSDDEQQRIMDKKERKKDKKRKHHRDDNNEQHSEQYRPESSKRHKLNESSSSSSSSSSQIINEKKPSRMNFNNKCDNNNDKTYSNGDMQSGGDDDPQSRWSRYEHVAEPTSRNHRTTTYSSNDDMFSAMLNMSDNLMASKNTSKTNNLGQGSSRSRSYNLNDESNPISGSSIDREIMQSLPYQGGMDNFYQQYYNQPPRMATATTSSNGYNFEIERQTAAMAGMKFKGRTQVFAGSSKITAVPEVFKLQDICIKVLMNHLDKINQVGDLPYHLLKPVLLKCTVQQLKRIESYNPQLLEETDELWKGFCEKEFKVKQLDCRRFGSWRDYYDHLIKQREEKLKNITRNINSKQRQAIPERKTQQIEHVKTPREIRRRQEKIVSTPYINSNRTGGGGGGPVGLRSSMTALNNPVANKSKTGPLMKKLLQMRQSKFRR